MAPFFTTPTHWLLACGLACSLGCDSSTSPTLPTPGGAPAPIQITYTGIATDSDNGAPLEGVKVCADFECALTADDGTYSFASLGVRNGFPSIDRGCVSAFREDFESRRECVGYVAGLSRWNAVLHRQVTINAGQSVSGTVLAGDGYGGASWEDYCTLCRAVRINVPGGGALALHVSSDTPGASVRLSFPYDLPDIDGRVWLAGARQVVAHVRGGSAPVRFTLSTAFTQR